MKTKLIFLTALYLIAGTNSKAQTKVASYSFGKPGTAKYENFSFWTKDGKRTTIEYAYGKDQKEVKLKYLGLEQKNGDSCFKVQFTNGYTLFVIPKGVKLYFTDIIGKYNKTFEWEYEGPINGVGTYCDVCADDDKDAMRLIRSIYMK